jgi:glucosamine--fructose-6-phosphate aminotransferase (isomerizing)
MNLTEGKYNKFALVREMMETPGIIRNFYQETAAGFVQAVSIKRGFFLTGEGSSRIFPAKRAIYNLLKQAFPMPFHTGDGI